MRHYSFYNFRLILLMISGLVICGFASSGRAQANGGVTVRPANMELVIPAGSERTVGMTVDYIRDFPTAELPMARLVARLEDWTLGPAGDMKFYPIATQPRSAGSWVTYSPSEFNLTADTRQLVRFTISVPKGTPPGDYYFACYVEGRTPPPPPKEGERLINIRLRYYTVFYVMVPDGNPKILPGLARQFNVPGLTTDSSLQGLETQVVNGYPVLMPQLGNKGNSHVRPQHKVEIRDAEGKTVFASQMSEALVLLGGHTWQMPFPIDVELPAGTYKLEYTVDFGDKKELQVGRTVFAITTADIAAREAAKKARAEAVAQEQRKAAQPPPATAVTVPAGTDAAQPAAEAHSPAPSAPAANNNAPSAAPVASGSALTTAKDKKP